MKIVLFLSIICCLNFLSAYKLTYRCSIREIDECSVSCGMMENFKFFDCKYNKDQPRESPCKCWCPASNPRCPPSSPRCILHKTCEI